MNSPKELGWAIVGASWIAERWVIDAIGAERSRAKGVFSTSIERGRAFAERTGLPTAYASLEDACADPEVDVVYVGTTNDLHREQTLVAAAAGKHVLCEKPLALTLSDARDMRDACRRAGVVMGTNHHLRSSDTHRKMRELVAAGTIGEVLSARVHTTRYLPDVLQTWRLTEPSSGGIILDITVHDADTLRFILGDEVEAVSAMAMQQGLGVGPVEDGVVGAMRMRSGTHVVFHEAFTHPHSGTAIELHGRDGVLIGTEIMNSEPTGTITLRRNGVPDTEIDVEPRRNPYERVVRVFNDATRAIGCPDATAEDGIASLAVALAVREAAATGRAVDVGPA